jgi:hypothetical protein
MRMRVTIPAALLIALLGAGLAYGQARQDAPKATQAERLALEEARRDFQRLDLSREELAGLRELVGKEQRALEQERARIREAQARLARLMLEAKPDLEAIRSTVRESLEAEYRIRMVQIERNIAIRARIGDARWAALSRLTRALDALSRSGRLDELMQRAGDEERLPLLLEIIKNLQ